MTGRERLHAASSTSACPRASSIGEITASHRPMTASPSCAPSSARRSPTRRSSASDRSGATSGNSPATRTSQGEDSSRTRSLAMAENRAGRPLPGPGSPITKNRKWEELPFFCPCRAGCPCGRGKGSSPGRGETVFLTGSAQGSTLRMSGGTPMPLPAPRGASQTAPEEARAVSSSASSPDGVTNASTFLSAFIWERAETEGASSSVCTRRNPPERRSHAACPSASVPKRWTMRGARRESMRRSVRYRPNPEIPSRTVSTGSPRSPHSRASAPPAKQTVAAETPARTSPSASRSVRSPRGGSGERTVPGKGAESGRKSISTMHISLP